METKLLLGTVLSSLLLLASYDVVMKDDQTAVMVAEVSYLSIIPAPKEIMTSDERVILTSAWKVEDDGSTAGRKARQQFLRLMSEYEGVKFKGQQAKVIRFHLIDSGEMKDEAYTISLSDRELLVQAASDSGLYYGSVTAWQMLAGLGEGPQSLKAQTIKDEPRFGWRGLMLDEARHFRGKAFVKKFIDWMALHKFNVFHWHLTDDQGWRIEIKKYPKLTDVAAWRLPAGDGAKLDIDPKSGKPRLIGGYYTQEQIRNIVKYAAERHITIVPEIDIPGHAQAPLMAYPQFGTSDIKAGPVSADWGIFNYSYNLEEKTFTFFKDVLTEVMDLFPGEYIHIGGDEVQKARWEMDPRIAERMKELGIKSVDEIQSYFTARIDRFLNTHGRKLIGWDEILEDGDLSKTATIMSWRGEKGGIEAAHKGYNVVMSPRPILYFDMLQSDSKREVTGRTNYQTLETIYNYNPVPQVLVGHGEEFVLGGQANIWSEHMRRALNVEHMVFPRAAAVAEVMWSLPEKKHFGNFVSRLPAQFTRYKKMGIRFADTAFEVKADIKNSENGNYNVQLSNQAGEGDIHFTLDGTSPTIKSEKVLQPNLVIAVQEGQTLKAATFVNGIQMAAVTEKKFDRHSLGIRTDEEMELCSNNIPLRLDDDYPAGQDADRAILTMDIMKPCWIYRSADLTGMKQIEVEVGQVPFNFQIGDDWKKITFPKPVTKYGEFNVYKGNSCEGEPLLSVPLEEAVTNMGITSFSEYLPQGLGKTDLCFRFAQHKLEPLWGLNKVSFK